jgi:outer membrane protein
VSAPSIAAAVFFAAWSPAAPEAAAAPRSSMTVSEAYHLAVSRSEALLLLQQSVAEADLRWLEAWTELGPVASIRGLGGVSQEQPTFGGGTTPLGELQIGGTLSQPLFRRSFFDARQAGKLGHQRAQETLTRGRETLMRDVVAVYITVLLTRQQIEVARAGVKRAEGSKQNASSRFKAGGALKTAELLAGLDLRRAQIQLVGAEQSAKSAATSFQTLIGEAPPAVLSLPPTPQPLALDEAVRRVDDRADLRALKTAVLEAKARADAARGRRWWPLLDLEASGFVFHPEVFTRTDWSVAGVITFPLFSTGAEHIAVQVEEIRATNAGLELARQAELAVDQVRQAWVRVEGADRAASLAEAQVKEAAENYQLVETQFRLGAVTFLDVANAQAVLTEADSIRVAAVYERELARYELLFAAGALALE